MTFENILGATAPIKGLEQSIYNDNIIQSLIINGPYGSGKRTLAKVYTNSLVCTNNKNKPCGMCGDCIKFLSENHLDIVYVGFDGKKAIGVDQIQYLHRDAFIRPNEGGRKVFIINNSHTMTIQAQNALLKLLEEPPAYLSIILLCQNIAPLLETILSRCIIVNMPLLSKALIYNCLIEKGIEHEVARISCIGAKGSLGKAYDLSTDGEYQNMRKSFCNLFFDAKDNKTLAFQGIIKHKSNIRGIIECWQSLVHDIMYVSLNKIDNVENVDRIEDIIKFSRITKFDQLTRILQALCECEVRLASNSQVPLVADYLLSQF